MPGGRALRLLLQLSLLACSMHGPEAVRPKVAAKRQQRAQHTLDDRLRPEVTPADVAHNNIQRFVREGQQYMARMGIELSPACDTRYGPKFIADQKYHFFRLCKSDAFLQDDGTLGNVTKTTPLARLRRKMEKQQKPAEKAAAADGAAASGGAGAQAAAAHGRRTLLTDERSTATRVAVDVGRRLHAANGSDGAGAQRRTLAAPGSNSLTYRLVEIVNKVAAARAEAAAAAKAEAEDGDGRNAGGDNNDVYNEDDEPDANAELDAKAATEADAPNAAEDSSKEMVSKLQAALAVNYFERDDDVDLYSVAGKPWKSSVGCYVSPIMPRHLGYKDAQMACIGRNLVLDTCALYAGQNEGFDVRFPSPKVGAIQAACTMNIRAMNDRNLTKGKKNRLWWTEAVVSRGREGGVGRQGGGLLLLKRRGIGGLDVACVWNGSQASARVDGCV